MTISLNPIKTGLGQNAKGQEVSWCLKCVFLLKDLSCPKPGLNTKIMSLACSEPNLATYSPYNQFWTFRQIMYGRDWVGRV